MELMKKFKEIVEHLQWWWALIIAIPGATAYWAYVGKIPGPIILTIVLLVAASVFLIVVLFNYCKNPPPIVGPSFTHGGVKWTPVLYNAGKPTATIQVGDPLCLECGAPLFVKNARTAECPTEACKQEVYSFQDSIADTKEKARRDAIGRSGRKELKFG
ncbi:MAG TPA: hypothetical protein DEB40_03345 [Elusimicrobia bacterium]|nr:hypothetical protein [Elusimicrobiota bacterium]HBT60763.1 hypothetical protein [Elusimicrobiota bacterium]